MMTTRAATLQRLDDATTLDDVVHNLDLVIDWAIQARSTIGYFAVLYQRGTVAVQQAIEQGRFHDPVWIEHMDVLFANRYFAALNGFFHGPHPAVVRPIDQDGLTLPWEVAFVNHDNNTATMLQHMMASLNAHICYDLGVALVTLSANSLDKVEYDFNLINDIVSAQSASMLHVVQQRSPGLRWIRRVVPDEVSVIHTLLVKFRTASWHFAINMALHPEQAREAKVNQVAWTSGLGAWYLNPPKQLAALPLLVRAIQRSESRDVAANVAALAGISRDDIAMATT